MLILGAGEWVEVRVFRTDGTSTLLRIESGPKVAPEVAPEPAPETARMVVTAPMTRAVPAETNKLATLPAPVVADQRSMWIIGVVLLSLCAFFGARLCSW